MHELSSLIEPFCKNVRDGLPTMNISQINLQNKPHCPKLVNERRNINAQKTAKQPKTLRRELQTKGNNNLQ